MNTYIIGAGASKSYSKSPTGLKMPVAKEFFKTFNNLKISESPFVLIGNVLNYLKKYHDINPIESMNYNEDIEVLYSEVEDQLNNALVSGNIIDKIEFLSVYNQLVFLFTSVVNEIQNGPVSKAHNNLISQLGENDSIITFNWDTLIDRTLSMGKGWSTDTGYCVSPIGIYRDKWEKPDGSKTSKIKLLKLHGSTNWLTSYIVFDENQNISFTHEGAPNSFFVYENTITPYPCYDGRYIEGYQPFSYCYYPPNLPINGKKAPDGYFHAKILPRTVFTPKGSSSKEGLISMPLIIPPVRHKKYIMFGDLFKTLWEKAEIELKNAERIFILGYSFPITDIRTNELIKDAFMARNNIPEIIIVNPDPEAIENKFKFDFGIPSAKIKVYKEYIDEDYCFQKL